MLGALRDRHPRREARAARVDPDRRRGPVARVDPLRRGVYIGAVTWTARHPDPARVRAEVEGMTDAYVAALLERLPREQIVGLYAKGSAVKPWDAPIDYVPELSDVDLHVLVHDPARL